MAAVELLSLPGGIEEDGLSRRWLTAFVKRRLVLESLESCLVHGIEKEKGLR